MTLTEKTKREIERCLSAFRAHLAVPAAERAMYPLPTRSAARRASMDLTRALSEWRKAGYLADEEKKG